MNGKMSKMRRNTLARTNSRSTVQELRSKVYSKTVKGIKFYGSCIEYSVNLDGEKSEYAGMEEEKNGEYLSKYEVTSAILPIFQDAMILLTNQTDQKVSKKMSKKIHSQLETLLKHITK